MRDSLALGGGPYHFFDRSSRNAAASNICSASSFFSLAFSSSSCRSRLASDTSIPPNLAFQLYSVASETPYLRANSAVFAPASCSRSTPIICSSVNLARFICPSFRRPDSNFNWRKSAGAGHDHALRWSALRHKRPFVLGEVDKKSSAATKRPDLSHGLTGGAKTDQARMPDGPESARYRDKRVCA